MKVDKRFHCFGCQADGDVIDFTGRLFSLSPREAALKLASVMDDPDWPKVGKGFDNVTPSTFLRYCQALHILPPDVTKGKTEEDDGILSHSKWGGTASDGDKGKGDAKDLHSAAESADA